MFSFRCTSERNHWTLLLCLADKIAAAGRSGCSNPNFGRHCGHCTALIPAQSSSNEGLHQQMSSITHFFCCSRSQLIFTFMVFFKTHSLTDIDECRNTSSCLNGATCQNTIGNFKCTCAKGFTGDNCGKVENICMKTPFFSSWRKTSNAGGSCEKGHNVRATNVEKIVNKVMSAWKRVSDKEQNWTFWHFVPFGVRQSRPISFNEWSWGTPYHPCFILLFASWKSFCAQRQLYLFIELLKVSRLWNWANPRVISERNLPFFHQGRITIEANLVIFGRIFLVFFLFERSWKNMKNNTSGLSDFVHMPSSDHLGDEKASKKGPSLRQS